MSLSKNREERKMCNWPVLNVPSMSFTPNAIIQRNDSKSIMKLFEPIRSKSSSVIYFCRIERRILIMCLENLQVYRCSFTKTPAANTSHDTTSV